MRCIAYLKLSLKNVLAGWKSSLVMIILFPLGLSLFLGTVYSVAENQELLNVSIVLEDEDNTKASQDLISFLGDDQLKDIISIKKEYDEKNDVKLIIPKGYENNINSSINTEILYKNKPEFFQRKVLNEVLKAYHDGLYLAKQNLSVSQIEELQKISVTANLVTIKERDYYEENSLIGITFAASMMIMTLVIAEYTPLSKNLNKKTSLAPMSRNLHYNLEYISSVVYVCIMLFAYVLFYNIIGLSFNGVLLGSLIVILGTAIFISSISSFIVSFLKEQYGKVIGTVIMALPMIFQVALPQFLDDKFKYVSPTYVITSAYSNLLEGNIFSVELGALYLIGIVLFFISRAKVNYDWRVGK